MKNFCVVLFIVWFAGPACGSKGGGGGGGGGGGTTPTPMISSINPTSGTAGGGTNVTISGSGFSGSTTASIGSTALTNVTVVNANTITGTTGQSSTAGAMNVNVTTAGQTAPSLSNGFTYTAVLRAMINGTTNGSTMIDHDMPTTFRATESTTTNPYTINGYSWNCGQDLNVYGPGFATNMPFSPCVISNNPTPVFSYRHCASTSNPPRQPCTSGSANNGMRTYTMTLTVTDTQGNSNSTNYNVTVKNSY
jgi:hypothetical protein